MAEASTVYNHKDFEQKWLQIWDQLGVFHASAENSAEPYTILLPPPNITAQLHMGHGLSYTIQDMLVRYKRMKGFNACWLPGTDHAGIATQMMVEKSLEKEGLSRKAMGRDAFLERVWEWRDKYGDIILTQLRRMGFSMDWPRTAFTMSPELSRAVREVFVKLYDEGLIYRGERLVNWDPALQTAISDDEVENIEVNGHLWFIRYPVEGSDERLIVATTRPETMLGDTAVAVHPDDERYKHLVGKRVVLPLAQRAIPIIADEYVDKEFGSGVVKITPAHDPNDFKVGKRHGLPLIDVMNSNGTMNERCPTAYQGKDRFQARKEIVRALREAGLLDKEVAHRHTVPHSDRSKAVIEPRLSMQWYVKMAPLAAPAIAAAKSGELKFYPDSWKKTYLHWLENIEDWCISRQLWWGHRIPIWTCKDCAKVQCHATDPSACSACGSKNIEQDPDVLDTWFSSWLWPLSPFGWPDKTPDLDRFFPSNVLVTGAEIIFLWVARMIMAGYHFQGKLAFDHVYFNAIVCDKQGRKFSKTLGNGIDPLDTIEKYGADATRFTVVSLAPIGGRVRMAETDFETGARFVNKIWNASRFLMRSIKPGEAIVKLKPEACDLPTRWLLTELANVTVRIEVDYENYRLNDVVDSVYHFIWGSVCDWGLECAKEVLQGPDSKAKAQAVSALVYCLEGALRLLSPIMPFISEEIYSKLPHHPDWKRESCLAVSRFPTAAAIHQFPEDAIAWRKIQDLISGVRSVRSQTGIAPKQVVDLYVKSDQSLASLIQDVSPWVRRLASIERLVAGPSTEKPGLSLAFVGRGFEAYVPAEGLIDVAKERKRLEVEIARIEKIVFGLNNKLANPSFAERAPEDVVAETRAQKENMTVQLESLRSNLTGLS